MAFIDELLGRDENILYAARQHVVLLVSRIFTKLILIGILVATAIVYAQAFANNTTTIIAGFTASQLIPALAYFISVLLFLSIFSDFLRWNAEQFLITDRRLIQIFGALNKTVLDSPLEKISDARLTQSLFGRMFGYGTLNIYTATEDGYNLEHIVAPMDFKRALMEAKYNYERGFGYLDTPHQSHAVGYENVPNQQYSQSEAQRKIQELATLRDRGILSMDEFEAKKREILNRI